MQAVYIVLDTLGHPADIRADDRTPEHPCLRNDEAKGFPPDRRNQRPIDAGHAGAYLIGLIGSIVEYVALRRRTQLFLLQECFDFRADRGRRKPQVVAIDLDREILETFAAKNVDGPQNDMDALGVDQLPEETEAILRALVSRQGLRRSIAQLAIADMSALFPGYAPCNMMLDLEAAGAGKMIDDTQMPHEPQLAHQELIGRAIGQTLMTADRTSLRAQRSIRQSDHVPARVAHRQILVKREDDPAVW